MGCELSDRVETKGTTARITRRLAKEAKMGMPRKDLLLVR